MTERIRLDDLTSDQLAQLYDRLDELAEVSATRKRIARRRRDQLDQAEAAIARARALHARVLRMEALTCAHCGQAWPCPTVRVLDEPAPGTATTQAADGTTATRVTALYERWVKAGPPPLGTSVSRWWDARLVELHNVIAPPANQPEEQP
ncbi:hypothetical protein RFN58_07010 [Streptomyces iakyrus]|uniref:hypothetical protein n=1 Tax=Streptomyces iakyrus TaxID=68219 RepID=UPI000526037F|nr:hypothetical protein [Streptomyces iakyrus]